MFGAQPVQVVLVRPVRSPDGDELALVSTDLKATPAELVERYAARWNVEVLFEEARQVSGVGQARNRVRRAVERTVPFGLACVSLTVVWYALHGQPTLDVATRRALAPWYIAKHAPSFADMHAALRRVIIAAQYQPGRLVEPTPQKSSKSSKPGLPQHEVRKPSYFAWTTNTKLRSNTGMASFRCRGDNFQHVNGSTIP